MMQFLSRFLYWPCTICVLKTYRYTNKKTGRKCFLPVFLLVLNYLTLNVASISSISLLNALSTST